MAGAPRVAGRRPPRTCGPDVNEATKTGGQQLDQRSCENAPGTHQDFNVR